MTKQEQVSPNPCKDMTVDEYVTYHRELGLSEDLARAVYSKQKEFESDPFLSIIKQKSLDIQRLQESELWFRSNILGGEGTLYDDEVPDARPLHFT